MKMAMLHTAPHEDEWTEHATDRARVLAVLQAAEPGAWVAQLYKQTHTMVHSRIADLRRQGYKIECKKFSVGDYRYRLVEEKESASG